MKKSLDKELNTLLGPRAAKSAVPVKDLLSTGCTPLNLALSGRASGGIAKGTYLFMSGGSDSGKTYLAETILAEAANNEEFDKYDLVYVAPEHGALMDVEEHFGSRLFRRLEVEDCFTVEQLYDNLDDRLRRKKPFIEVVDSMDALESEQDVKQFTANKKARKEGKKLEESYQTAKPKANSRNIRHVANRIYKHGSILIIISQLRDNIGFGSTFEPEKVTGGKALWFYAHVWLWLDNKGQIKTRQKVNGKERELGTTVRCRVKKNRLTGRKRTVYFPILHSAGIDDLGACVNYLIDERHFKYKEKADVLFAQGFNFSGGKEDFIRHVVKEGKEKDLRKTVSQVYNKVESACVVSRPKRYK